MEGGRERGGGGGDERERGVCVCERESEREGEREGGREGGREIHGLTQHTHTRTYRAQKRHSRAQ